MELRDYINVIRARKWVIIQAVVIVTLATLLWSFSQPKVYSGSAEVLITEKDTASAILGNALPLSQQPERVLDTQVELVQIRPVAEAAIKKLNLQTTPDLLLQGVTVEAVGQTNIVRVTATNENATTASMIANAMADEYVRSVRDANRESIAAAADEVQKRLDQAKAEIIDLGHKISGSKAPTSSATDLQAELQIATATYSTLAEKLETLRINEQLETGPGRVVSPAVVNPIPVSAGRLRTTLVGLGLGLVLGLGLAFLYEYLDNTIKSTEEAEKLYGAPVLGTVPIDKMEKGEKRRLVVVRAPGSASAEAYRVLRNSLEFVNFKNDIKTILVTSAAPGEGKSTVASNLAAALSQAGKKVVLVSVDFRRPTTDQFFDVNNMIGLSDVLLGTHSLKSALQRPGDEQLLVLASGKMPPNPSELLGSSKMREVLGALGEWGEWVIIDAPPLLAVADPAAVARWTDGVLMVTQAGVTTREAAKKAYEVLEKVGARTIGVVVWGLDDSRGGSAGYGHYAGGYYYSSYYGQPAEKAQAAGQKALTAGGTPPPGIEDGWVPPTSAGSRFVKVLGRILTGVMAFIVVIVVAAAIAYLLSGYFGWHLDTMVLNFLSRG
jgi:capsular exopolysaccharide synthesis family protein